MARGAVCSRSCVHQYACWLWLVYIPPGAAIRSDELLDLKSSHVHASHRLYAASSSLCHGGIKRGTAHEMPTNSALLHSQPASAKAARTPRGAGPSFWTYI
ncbi:hypothetical protein BDY17DRAFT_183832 [Neohortaea acidophila]|uniref:Uncharacterized protein n=1 Tax=Neohortaea acidophila TaxID=245834 RepID=A0A6A6PME1_9PEZI|nr:uncharacterized protein BDY17DRAFT_183832 [Neohortaea acidophila]KAF2481162.1 hypothetical protein BDY17DRAFT_183832 [Neohortaea acidophila]